MNLKSLVRTGAIVFLGAGMFACRSDMTPTDTGVPPNDAADMTMPHDAADVVGNDTPVNNDVPVNNDTMMGGSYTVQTIANPDAPGRPTVGAVVTLSGNLVALSPRFVSGPSSHGNCTYTIWVGDPAGGPFSAIEVVASETAPTIDGGADCPGNYDMTLIPAAMKAGDTVTSVTGELDIFCPTAEAGMPCPPNAPLQLFMNHSVAGRQFTATAGTGGPTPPPTTVAISDINGTGTTNNAMDLALQSTLVTVNAAFQQVVPVSGTGGNHGEMTISAAASDMTTELPVVVESFHNASCVRNALATAGVGASIGNVTGILEYDFGAWKIQIVDENAISGITPTCATSDAGTDAATDVATDVPAG